MILAALGTAKITRICKNTEEECLQSHCVDGCTPSHFLCPFFGHRVALKALIRIAFIAWVCFLSIKPTQLAPRRNVMDAGNVLALCRLQPATFERSKQNKTPKPISPRAGGGREAQHAAGESLALFVFWQEVPKGSCSQLMFSIARHDRGHVTALTQSLGVNGFSCLPFCFLCRLLAGFSVPNPGQANL